jgi:hypothetical protein
MIVVHALVFNGKQSLETIPLVEYLGVENAYNGTRRIGVQCRKKTTRSIKQVYEDVERNVTKYGVNIASAGTRRLRTAISRRGTMRTHQ